MKVDSGNMASHSCDWRQVVMTFMKWINSRIQTIMRLDWRNGRLALGASRIAYIQDPELHREGGGSLICGTNISTYNYF